MRPGGRGRFGAGLRTLEHGEALAAAGGVSLLVLTFLRWYGLSGAAVAFDPEGFTAWEAFTAIDIVIAATALAAAGPRLLAVAGWRGSPPRLRPEALAGLGALSTVLIAWRLVDPPLAGAEVEAPAVLGLLAAGAIAAGSWLAARSGSG